MMIEQQEKSKFIEKLIDWGEKYIVREKFFFDYGTGICITLKQ